MSKENKIIKKIIHLKEILLKHRFIYSRGKPNSIFGLNHKSKFGQDFIVENMFEKKENGFFIELGALVWSNF